MSRTDRTRALARDFALPLMAVLLLAVGILTSCGSDDESCEGVGGTICNNCAQDCLDIELNCSADQEEACVGLTFFGDDNPQDLRCTFCLDPE